MRRWLFGSGLCLVLGVVTSSAYANPPCWRPAAQTGPPAAPPAPAWRAPAAQTPAPGPSGISIRKPEALGGSDGGLTPVAFSPGAPETPQPLVRAKSQDGPAQPMPVGPADKGDKGAPAKQPETAPAPNPVPNPGNVWGGPVISQWNAGPGGPHDGAIVPIPDGGPVGPDGACCDGGACCPGRGRGGRLLGGLFSGGGLFGGRSRAGVCCDDACCDNVCCDGACPTGPCPECWGQPCCPGCTMDHVWGRAEYLLWWIRDGHIPTLVTASPADTPRAVAGVLGQNGTVPLFGNELQYNMFSGGRFTLGFGIPGTCNCGLEATYFFLGQRSINFAASSNGSPILTRPVTNVLTGNVEPQLVAFPGVVVGTVGVSSSSRLWGAEGNARHRLLCGCNGYLDLLGGFRYLELGEDLSIVENLVRLDPAGGPGTGIILFDSFATKNQFYGGQLGLDGEYRFKRFFVGGTVKLALGVMHEQVSVNGGTTFMVPGLAPIAATGGLLALPSNIGSRTSNQFAFVPEVGLRFGYNVSNNVRIFVGYNFLWVSNVARPGDQIDPVINRSQQPTAFGPGTLVGAARPMPLFQHTDFWAQGVTFGVEIRY